MLLQNKRDRHSPPIGARCAVKCVLPCGAVVLCCFLLVSLGNKEVAAQRAEPRRETFRNS